MKITLTIIIVSLTLVYSISQNTNTSSDIYILLKRINNIEIRDYKESLNASYYSESETEKNNYFRNLASYIFGGNSKNETISMTSPVTIRLYGDREMIFRMPEKYSLDNLPKADNPMINFLIVPSCKKAAIRYGGYSNDYIEGKKIKELKEVLRKNNISHTNRFEVLVYNAPYKIFNRRNEITVNITYP